MFRRHITSFISIFLAAAIATVHNDPHFVTVSGPEVTVYPLTTQNPESSTGEPEQQVMETAAVDLGALLDAGDGAVITLVAGDTRLAAHRAVLLNRSPVFAATLQHMTLEASGDQVAIPDVEGPVLRQMLAYMYTLQPPQLPGMAPQLLAAADTYGLPSLKAHCEQQVVARLSVETAAASAILAVKHSCATLRQAAISFIKAHILHVVATQGWADAINGHPEDLMKVIRLLSKAPVEACVPATGGNGTAPTTQPHSDHSRHRGQTPAFAAQPTTSLSTSPSDVGVSRLRAAAAAASGAAPTTQPGSDHSGQTPASAAPTTAAPHTPTPDYTAVCPLWGLSAEEKNRRLIKAATDGAVQEVQALLAAGADVEARDSEQWTPLHRAIYSGSATVVRLLVEEASADVNARNDRGRTPLHMAAYSGRAEAAAVLLQAGADRGATDEWGDTPLDDARKKNHQELVDMLTMMA